MTAYAMYFPRTPRPVGQNFAETTLENTPRTDASLPSPNPARAHGKQLPASPLRREASNLLARGLLARLNGGDAENKSAKRMLQSLPTFLRPHTTAVRPPLPEDGQPPSLQSRERSFFGPRAVSEPKPRTPLPSIDQVNTELEVRRKREEVVTRRVEQALEETRRAKEKQREDVLAGVPRHYAFKPPKCLVIYEDDLQRFRRKRRKANREARLAERRRAASEGKAPGKRVSPSRTAFPKVTDFISREQTRIDMDNATLEWTLPTRSYHHSQPAVHRPVACGVSGGKLCRSFYPVTEALHREGTSVSKLKGRSLAPGDCLVAKVWPRNLQKFATPLEMATEDRRFFYRGQLAVSQHSSQQRLSGLGLEHESTLYERQQMEERYLKQLQQQLQQMEQRRLEQELVHRELSREEQQEQSEQPDQEQQEEHDEQYEQTEKEQVVAQGEREITEQRLHEHQLESILNENEHNEEPTVEEKERHQQGGEKRLQLHIEILQAVEKEGDEDVEEDEDDEEEEEDD